MTASTPRRSRSACQSGTGSAPAYRTARAASVSSSDPGNVTTPIRTLEVYPQAASPQETSQVRQHGRSGAGLRGRPADALAAGSLRGMEGEFLDHGIGEQLAGKFLDRRQGGAVGRPVELKLEPLPLADTPDVAEAETM